jgi:hypothetical protein
MRDPSGSGGRYRVVLEFLQLDDESEAFLRRLADSFEAESVEPFRLDRYVERGRRGIRRPPSGSFAAVSSPSPTSDQPAAHELPEETEHGPDPATSPLPAAARAGSARWLWRSLALVATVAAAGAATGFVIKIAAFLGRIPPIDPLPATAATAVHSEARLIPAHNSIRGQPATSPESALQPVAPPAVADAAALHPRRIQQVTWHDADEFTVVTVLADDIFQESEVRYFRMESGPQPRMVLYLYGFGPSDLEYRTEVGGKHLAAIRVWHHGDRNPEQLHIVLDLPGPEVMAYKPVVEGRRLLVTLGPRG